MKIVINKSYGGFSLSPKAVKWLAEKRGQKCYFFKSTYDRITHQHNYTPWTEDPPGLPPGLPPLPPPMELPPHEFHVKHRLDILVTTWDQASDVWYRIVGLESDAMKFYFENILSVYPCNPYFTSIVSKCINLDSKFEMVIKRSNTSD